MKRVGLLSGLFGLVVVGSGCAAINEGPPDVLTGASGPVSWEVVDVGRIDSADGLRSRWSYVIVLRERAGVPIQFWRVEQEWRGVELHTGGVGIEPFDRRLEPRSELRYVAASDFGWLGIGGRRFGGASALSTVTVERRFVGKDTNGNAVVIPVPVSLHRGFGKPSRQPSSSAEPLPPARTLQPDDLRTLAGRWEGYYQLQAFHVPMEAAIREDGVIEVGVNDPVTGRFRASLSIQEGRVLWYSGGEGGILTLHEGDGKRILAGWVKGSATGAGPPPNYPVRLEAVEPRR